MGLLMTGRRMVGCRATQSHSTETRSEGQGSAETIRGLRRFGGRQTPEERHAMRRSRIQWAGSTRRRASRTPLLRGFTYPGCCRRVGVWVRFFAYGMRLSRIPGQGSGCRGHSRAECRGEPGWPSRTCGCLGMFFCLWNATQSHSSPGAGVA